MGKYYKKNLKVIIFLLQKVSSFTAEVRAKPEYHKFLIGRGGANVRKLRESTGARVIFPSPNDQDQELITVIGTSDSVEGAKKELEDLIKNMVRVGVKFHALGWNCEERALLYLVILKRHVNCGYKVNGDC